MFVFALGLCKFYGKRVPVGYSSAIVRLFFMYTRVPALARRETTNSPHCSAKASQWLGNPTCTGFPSKFFSGHTNIFMKIEVYPKHLLFSRFWVTTGRYSYQQQPDRTPVCQASLTTTKFSEYSNSTAVGFEPVRRQFVALQTPVSSYVASRDRQHDPAQRSANKATCSTERTALVRRVDTKT